MRERNTDIGIYKADVNNPHVLIDLGGVGELHGIAADGDGVWIGAAATLQELVEWIDSREHVPSRHGVRVGGQL